MKKLLKTLYVLTPDSYIFTRNENICVKIGDAEKLNIPALNIDSIVCFGKMTVSTPLLEFCGDRGISLAFIRENGHFMGRLQGPVSGNVLLRKRQYASMDDEAFVQKTVQSILLAKLRNSKLVLMRSARSDRGANQKEALEIGIQQMNAAVENLLECNSVDSMRGVEGAAANAYFARFDCMLAGNPGGFHFETRSRRPPRNEVNAALSFSWGSPRAYCSPTSLRRPLSCSSTTGSRLSSSASALRSTPSPSGAQPHSRSGSAAPKTAPAPVVRG
mgnify:CR=1 FL=1